MRRAQPSGWAWAPALALLLLAVAGCRGSTVFSRADPHTPGTPDLEGGFERAAVVTQESLEAGGSSTPGLVLVGIRVESSDGATLAGTRPSLEDVVVTDVEGRWLDAGTFALRLSAESRRPGEPPAPVEVSARLVVP